MAPLQILIFDLDEVLLFSRGYRAALRGAVGYFGDKLGFPDVRLSDEDVEVFEAFGLTAEWDSATVCVSLMLAQLWKRFPDYTLTLDGDWPASPSHGLPTPAFQEFVAGLGPCDNERSGPLRAAEAALLERCPFLSSDQVGLLKALYASTRRFDGSPIHRLVQEFNLGSRRYAKIYTARPRLEVESTLLTQDRPRLDVADRIRLMDWARGDGHGAVIFTNRPSTPPDGAFDTPEAELGLDVSGLATLKVVGGGGLGWLAQRRGLGSGELLKPSPVHALAALRLALGRTLKEALEAAAGLALEGKVDSDWRRLNGSGVYVFEDSAKGLRSASRAADILREHGVTIRCTLFGVSDSEPKRAALAAAGATLYTDVQSALATLDGLQPIGRLTR
jgi:hypothetical protein